MANEKERIILDTNLWISFLIKNDLSKLDELLFDKQVNLIFSKELLEEFITVVSRPKLQKYFSEKDVHQILEKIDFIAKFIEVKSKVKECRGPKDNFLLSLCIDSKADYLITGDADLLEIQKFHNTTILTLTEYLRRKNLKNLF